ncbi:hypothetical protein LguiA_030314 [Lonicera macranthoides]
MVVFLLGEIAECSNASSNAMNEGIDGSKGFEALEYIDEGEVLCPKAPDKGHKKKKKGSPNGGGGRAKNSKVLMCNVARVTSSCIPNWGLVHNTPTNGVGRVWITWNPKVFDIQVLQLHTQSVDCLVTITQKVFAVTGVYGYNTSEERWDLWRDLRRSSNAMGQFPWILMGDFNIVRTHEERVGGNMVDRAEMEDFNCCLHDIEVDDMSTKGLPFTWDNKRGEEASILSRIDRVVQNDNWGLCFPNSEAEIVPPGPSDHCASYSPNDKRVKLENVVLAYYRTSM